VENRRKNIIFLREIYTTAFFSEFNFDISTLLKKPEHGVVIHVNTASMVTRQSMAIASGQRCIDGHRLEHGAVLHVNAASMVTG
jgi:hypothetical protein